MIFTLNFLSHLLVALSLLDLLWLSIPSRIIFVSPSAAILPLWSICDDSLKPFSSPFIEFDEELAGIRFDDFDMRSGWSFTRAIGQSRLGIACITRNLGEKLKGTLRSTSGSHTL